MGQRSARIGTCPERRTCCLTELQPNTSEGQKRHQIHTLRCRSACSPCLPSPGNNSAARLVTKLIHCMRKVWFGNVPRRHTDAKGLHSGDSRAAGSSRQVATKQLHTAKRQYNAIQRKVTKKPLVLPQSGSGTSHQTHRCCAECERTALLLKPTVKAP